MAEDGSEVVGLDGGPAAAAPGPDGADGDTGSLGSLARVFGVLTLACFSFGYMANVNSVPPMATYGLGSIFWYGIAILFLLVPTALVSSELGAAIPRTGGIYLWVREALGTRLGFVVIFFEFAYATISLPVVMTTIASTLAYAVDPDLVSNKLFNFLAIQVALWITAIITLRGLKLARNLNLVAVIAGNLIPGIVIVGLAIYFLGQGNKAAMSLSPSTIVPDLGEPANLVFATSALLMFAGIEISGMHAAQVRKPGRTIPRANALTALFCICLFVPVTLAVAVVVPSGDLNVVAGMAEASQDFFNQFGLSWMVPVFAILLAGGLSIVVVEIFGSSGRGLAVSARDGNLPRVFQKFNGAGMPVTIVWGQATIASVVSVLFLLLPSVQNAWWSLVAVQTQLVLIIYVLMYVAVIRLRRKRADLVRPYKIPGGKAGLYFVTGLGILTCLAGIGLLFIPPAQLVGVSFASYAGAILAGTGLVVAIPLVVHHFRRPSWVDPDVDQSITEPEPEPV